LVEPNETTYKVYEQKHAIQKTMDVPTRYVPKSKYEELKRFTILGGDIIVSCRGTIGEIFIVPDGAPMGIMHPSMLWTFCRVPMLTVF
jgi:type I restriction enzyme S subunit